MAKDIPTSDAERQKAIELYLARVKSARELQHAEMAAARAMGIAKPDHSFSHYYSKTVETEKTAARQAKSAYKRQERSVVPA